MIEMVHQHHPEIGETQIREWMNQAITEFCRKTRCIKSVHTLTSSADQRYYLIPSNILEVTGVAYGGYAIPKLVGRPEQKDFT
jgi:hypothetical protein